MWFEIQLYKNGLISGDQLVTAVEQQLSTTPQLGKLAILSKRMSMKQLFEVLCCQSECLKPFGEVCIDLGVLTRSEVAELLLEQQEATKDLKEILIESGSITRVLLESARERTYREGALETVHAVSTAF